MCDRDHMKQTSFGLSNVFKKNTNLLCLFDIKMDYITHKEISHVSVSEIGTQNRSKTNLKVEYVF